MQDNQQQRKDRPTSHAKELGPIVYLWPTCTPLLLVGRIARQTSKAVPFCYSPIGPPAQVRYADSDSAQPSPVRLFLQWELRVTVLFGLRLSRVPRHRFLHLRGWPNFKYGRLEKISSTVTQTECRHYNPERS